MSMYSVQVIVNFKQFPTHFVVKLQLQICFASSRQYPHENSTDNFGAQQSSG